MHPLYPPLPSQFTLSGVILLNSPGHERGAAMVSVLLLRRDYSTDAAFGVGYVTPIAGDEVHVYMEDTLTSGFVYVDAYVVSIGVKLLVNALLYVLQHHVHRLALVIGQVEVAGYVTLGYDECMTW